MRYILEEDIILPNVPPYTVYISEARELILAKKFPDIDQFGSEISVTMYAPLKKPVDGFKVLLNYIENKKLKYFRYSIGSEKKRLPLYRRLARKVCEHGFTLMENEGVFYFFRNENQKVAA